MGTQVKLRLACKKMGLFCRAVSFFYSSFDKDEALYLLMGRDWLDGRLPYTGVWDHKPPLLAGIFALAQILFGRNVHSIRILAVLAVAGTSLNLYLLGSRLCQIAA